MSETKGRATDRVGFELSRLDILLLIINSHGPTDVNVFEILALAMLFSGGSPSYDLLHREVRKDDEINLV